MWGWRDDRLLNYRAANCVIPVSWERSDLWPTHTLSNEPPCCTRDVNKSQITSRAAETPALQRRVLHLINMEEELLKWGLRWNLVQVWRQFKQEGLAQQVLDTNVFYCDIFPVCSQNELFLHHILILYWEAPDNRMLMIVGGVIYASLRYGRFSCCQQESNTLWKSI